MEGNFCRQHYLDWSAQDKNDKILSEWRDLVEDAAVTWLVALPSCPTVINCQVYIWLTMTDAIMDNSACFPLSENEYFCLISR